ncbi:MAG: single-stranded DNA-binding protein [Sporolactobacillus sp.]
MINRVVLVGRLTKTPELRYTPKGVAVTTFTLAVNRPFTNQQGERQADFIPIVVWRTSAENAANYLSKGSLVGIDGRIQTRSYETNEGRRVYVTEVVADSVQYLEKKGARTAPTHANPALSSREPGVQGETGSPTPAAQVSGAQSTTNGFADPFANDGTPIDISDDDLPF